MQETSRVDTSRVEMAELLEEVRRIDVLSRRLVNSVLSGGYTSVFRGSGIEFDDVREYVEGDDPRSVDWNVTARVGRPYIKKYVDEREQTVMFVFDLSPSMGAGFGAWSVRQMATRIAACLALSAVRNDDKAGLIAFGQEVEHYLPPRKGVPHVLRIIRDLLALGGSGGGTDLAPALEFTMRAVRKRSTVFVVSDFLSEGWAAPMAMCARRHDVIAVRMLPRELEPPDRGLVRLHDPETGVERVIDWSSPEVRRAWAQRVERWTERTEAELMRAKVDRMDVPVPHERDKDAVAAPILKFFRMREQREAKW
ncbi:MAG: DUF58 domain-containing protein [Planctomycetota bacterium]|jgi:uncharacterized protein (DUF58 family)